MERESGEWSCYYQGPRTRTGHDYDDFEIVIGKHNYILMLERDLSGIYEKVSCRGFIYGEMLDIGQDTQYKKIIGPC